MIELVFVIVIIGILAAVALPRFTGIADDAHVSKLQAFVGTLNRTVAPSMWSGVQRNIPTAAGSLRDSGSATYNTIVEGVQVESVPSELANPVLATTGTILLSGCRDANQTQVPQVGGTAPSNGDILAASVSIGGNSYMIGCHDSDLAQAPVFYLYNESNSDIIIAR